jgi:hypothetical protein
MTDNANRAEQNSKAFLDMEEDVHDLHRLTAIAYDYAIKLIYELREIRRQALRPEVDKYLSPEDEENITFLFGQIVKASAKLPKFYDPEQRSNDDA